MSEEWNEKWSIVLKWLDSEIEINIGKQKEAAGL